MIDLNDLNEYVTEWNKFYQRTWIFVTFQQLIYKKYILQSRK